MDKEFFTKAWQEHKGRIVGVSLGLIVGIVFVTIGFWKTVILSICVGIGYWIGGMNDRQERFMNSWIKYCPRVICFMWVSKHGLLDFMSLIHIQDMNHLIMYGIGLLKE